MSFTRDTIEAALCASGNNLEDLTAAAMRDRSAETRADVIRRCLSGIDGTAGLVERLAFALPELPEAHREDAALALAELAGGIAVLAAVAEGARAAGEPSP